MMVALMLACLAVVAIGKGVDYAFGVVCFSLSLGIFLALIGLAWRGVRDGLEQRKRARQRAIDYHTRPY